jgi:hypothetical protein
MRILNLVFSFLVTLAVTVLALAYVPRHVGRQRVYLDPPGIAIPDTAAAKNLSIEGTSEALG